MEQASVSGSQENRRAQWVRDCSACGSGHASNTSINTTNRSRSPNAPVGGSAAPLQGGLAHGLFQQPERRQVLGRAPGDEAGPVTASAELERQRPELRRGQPAQEVQGQPSEPGAGRQQEQPDRTGIGKPVSASGRRSAGPGRRMARESSGRNALRWGQRVSAVDRSGLTDRGEAEKGLDPATIGGDGMAAPGVAYRRWCPSAGAVERPAIRASGEEIVAVPGHGSLDCHIHGVGDVTWMPGNEERFRRLPGSWR